MLTFESSQLQGARDIIEKLVSLPFTKVAHRISTLDAQPASENGDVLVMVTGELLVDEEQNSQRYSQVFHLIPENGSYFRPKRSLPSTESLVLSDSNSNLENSSGSLPQSEASDLLSETQSIEVTDIPKVPSTRPKVSKTNTSDDNRSSSIESSIPPNVPSERPHKISLEESEKPEGSDGTDREGQSNEQTDLNPADNTKEIEDEQNIPDVPKLPSSRPKLPLSRPKVVSNEPDEQEKEVVESTPEKDERPEQPELPSSRPKMPSSRPKMPSSRPQMTQTKQEEQPSTTEDSIEEDTVSSGIEKETEEDATSIPAEIEKVKEIHTTEDLAESISKDSPPQIPSSRPKMLLSRPSSTPKIPTSIQQEKEDLNAGSAPQEEDASNVETVSETAESLPTIPTSRPKIPISRPKIQSSVSSESKSDYTAEDRNLTIDTNSEIIENTNSTDPKTPAYSTLIDSYNVQATPRSTTAPELVSAGSTDSRTDSTSEISTAPFDSVSSKPIEISTESEIITQKKAPPKVPKKPSSKIAAFQQMLAQQQQQDLGLKKIRPFPKPAPKPVLSRSSTDEADSATKEINEAPEESDPTQSETSKPKKLTTARSQFAKNLDGMIGMGFPGMAFGGLPPVISPPNNNTNESTEEESEKPVKRISDIRLSRARGPRGRKLPDQVKKAVVVDDESLGKKKYSIKVFDVWTYGADINGQEKESTETELKEIEEASSAKLTEEVSDSSSAVIPAENTHVDSLHDTNAVEDLKETEEKISSQEDAAIQEEKEEEVKKDESTDSLKSNLNEEENEQYKETKSLNIVDEIKEATEKSIIPEGLNSSTSGEHPNLESSIEEISRVNEISEDVSKSEGEMNEYVDVSKENN
ncbi:hypothetical protein B5S28_g1597 [[Candida] boidinii]|nr:hypothetical protein B5S28_g1597 [[Candida] boidinii]